MNQRINTERGKNINQSPKKLFSKTKTCIFEIASSRLKIIVGYVQCTLRSISGG